MQILRVPKLAWSTGCPPLKRCVSASGCTQLLPRVFIPAGAEQGVQEVPPCSPVPLPPSHRNPRWGILRNCTDPALCKLCLQHRPSSRSLQWPCQIFGVVLGQTGHTEPSALHRYHFWNRFQTGRAGRLECITDLAQQPVKLAKSRCAVCR